MSNRTRRKNKAKNHGQVAHQGQPHQNDQAPHGDTEQQQHIQQFHTYRGELPPPEDLRQFADMVPDLPERLLQRLESQTAHRHAIENKIVDSQLSRDQTTFKERRRGQWFAFILGLVGLAVSGTVALFSQTTAGATVAGIIGGTTLVSLVTAFLVGRSVKPPPPEPPQPPSDQPN